jgi:hypothetical protein
VIEGGADAVALARDNLGLHVNLLARASAIDQTLVAAAPVVMPDEEPRSKVLCRSQAVAVPPIVTPSISRQSSTSTLCSGVVR